MTRYILLIALISVLSLTASFFCSMLEACLYSISRSRIETLRRKGNRSGMILARMRNRIDESIAAILIVNTVANTMGAAWAGAVVGRAYGDSAIGWFAGAFTFCILFFGEIVPKSLGVRFASQLGPILAPFLQLLVWVFWPIIKLSVLLTRVWGASGQSHGTAEDIISLARLVAGSGSIGEHEVEWVTNALRLDEMTAYDLMTPNPVVARVPGVMKLSDTRIDADHWRFSRIPVCMDDNPDRVIGVVHRRDVFDALARDDFKLTMEELMEPPEFVPSTMPAHELLDRFLKRRRHLFCVLDERENFAGVVTLEDVMECLLGREIVDETDLHENMQDVAEERKQRLLSQRPSKPLPPKP
jgi:CBS domain containing-hemolysin-like protein